MSQLFRSNQNSNVDWFILIFFIMINYKVVKCYLVKIDNFLVEWELPILFLVIFNFIIHLGAILGFIWVDIIFNSFTWDMIFTTGIIQS